MKRIALILGCVGMCACISTPKGDVLDRKVDIDARVMQAQSSDAESQTIDWAEAMRLMPLHHPDMLRAEHDLREAYRTYRRLYESLIPELGLLIGYDNNLAWTRDESRAWDAQLFLYLYLTRWIELPLRKYAASLQCIRAGLAWRAAVRERIFAAYSASLDLQLIQEQLADARWQAELMSRHTDLFGEQERHAQLMQVAALQHSLEQGRKILQATIGLSHVPFEVDLQTIPDFSEKGRALLPLVATGDFPVDSEWKGLLAVEIVGLEAQRRGAVLDYWPDLRIYLNPPQTTWNPEDGFRKVDMGRDTTFRVDLYWSPQRWINAQHNIQRMTAELGLRERAMMREIDAHVDQTKQLAAGIVQMDQEIMQLERQIETLKRYVSGELLPDPQRAIQSLRRRMARLRVLQRDQRVALARLWFMSEQVKEVVPNAPKP